MSELRIGLGVDAHALRRRDPARARRRRLPRRAGLAGHSDGDVIAHALIDAILGAAGKGDIGELFPSGGSAMARRLVDPPARSGATRSCARPASSS